MDINEFRNQSPERLITLAAELRARIRDLRFTIGTRQRANVRDLRKVKKELARLLTVRNAPQKHSSL